MKHVKLPKSNERCYHCHDYQTHHRTFCKECDKYLEICTKCNSHWHVKYEFPVGMKKAYFIEKTKSWLCNRCATKWSVSPHKLKEGENE